MTRDQSYQLVTSMLTNPNLVKHCLAVEAIMVEVCEYLQDKHPELSSQEFDKEEWGLVGLLHDADYEVTNKDLETHTDVIVGKLQELKESERLIKGILAHRSLKKPVRDNLMEKAIYCIDELAGLITACALVQPEKKLSSVTVESVMKKFKQSSFAAGANRDQIKTFEDQLNISLEEFIALTLKTMQTHASELGL